MKIKLDLSKSNLTELTESDLIQFCELNEIKPKYLYELYLCFNKLTELNCFTENTVFKNLQILEINYNNIKNINNIKYLKKLKKLYIDYNSIKNKEKEISDILNNLKYFKDIIFYDENNKWNYTLIRNCLNKKINIWRL